MIASAIVPVVKRSGGAAEGLTFLVQRIEHSDCCFLWRQKVFLIRLEQVPVQVERMRRRRLGAEEIRERAVRARSLARLGPGRGRQATADETHDQAG